MPISSYQEAYFATKRKAISNTQNAFATRQEHKAVIDRLKAILQQPTTQSSAENITPGVEDELEGDPTLISADNEVDKNNYYAVDKIEALKALTDLQHILQPKREVKGHVIKMQLERWIQ
ncbi:hypothetical protein CVT24_007905 [Panaeolus cyanescens]|uniref:Uncharacterized protein n=1 Tax=Panaeolus cyanescens TaxID=181874 RepID=A0A409WZX5_9AGAR|nr:hypothetical protein CVT24_007905 [Panaeolus cyanescens]